MSDMYYVYTTCLITEFPVIFPILSLLSDPIIYVNILNITPYILI